MDIKRSLKLSYKRRRRPPIPNMSQPYKSFSLKSLFSYLEELETKLQQQHEMIKALTQQVETKVSISELGQHELEVSQQIDQIKSDIKSIIGD